MLENLNFIAAAFAIVWIGLFIYIFMLMQKERAIRRDLENLRRELKDNR